MRKFNKIGENIIHPTTKPQKAPSRKSKSTLTSLPSHSQTLSRPPKPLKSLKKPQKPLKPLKKAKITPSVPHEEAKIAPKEPSEAVTKTYNIFTKIQILKIEMEIREAILDSKNWRFISEDKKTLNSLYHQLAAEKGYLNAKNSDISAAINDTINDSGWTGLMYSAYHHLPKAIDFFISHNSNTSKTNTCGWNALFLLCMNEKFKEVCGTCMGCFLHKHDRKIYCDNHFRMLNIAESLLEAGCDYKTKDTVGNTVMVYCERIKNITLLELFKYLERVKRSDRKRKEFLFIWDKVRKRKGERERNEKAKALDRIPYNLVAVI